MTFSRRRIAAFSVALAAIAGIGDAAAQRRGGRPAQEQPQQIPTGQQEKTFPFKASWTATQLNGKSIADRRATLLVDDNLRGTGFAGCNTFSASAYPLRQQNFAVGPVALTKRACDKGAMDFERTYLVALRGARSWDLVQGRLVIKGAGGELTFDRAL